MDHHSMREKRIGFATIDELNEIYRPVRTTHTPVFKSHQGAAHTNGATGFICGTTVIETDRPLLELMMAADDAERADMNFRNAASC
jgi:hypothetical protein